MGTAEPLVSGDNLLRVRTFVAPSPGRGLGLFAQDAIPSGTVTWKYDSELDPCFEIDFVEALPDHSRSVIFKYGYFDLFLSKFVVPIDDLRFINHSALNRNIQSSPEMDVACKDIDAGEELLCNYRDYESDYFERRNLDPASWL